MHATQTRKRMRTVVTGTLVALTLATGCLIGTVQTASAQPPSLKEERGHSPYVVEAATRDPAPTYHHPRIGFLP